MISNVTSALMYRVASQYLKGADKIASEVVSMYLQDYNLLQNLLGEEGMIKLAEMEHESFRMPQDKQQFFKAPENLKKGFADLIVMTLEKAGIHGHHFTHVSDKEENESDEAFEDRKRLKAKVVESLNNFYEIVSNDLSKRLPKVLAKKFNDTFANKRYELFQSPSEAKSPKSNPLLSVDLQRNVIGKSGKLAPVDVRDAVEIFQSRIELNPRLSYLSDKFSGKPQQSENNNMYTFPSGLSIRTRELPTVTDSDIFIKASGSREGNEQFHDAMTALVGDMITHYIKEDNTGLKNMILDTVLGEVKETKRPTKGKGDTKTLSEREERKLELGDVKFIPRIDPKRREEILENLRKEQGITNLKEYVAGSEDYEVGMVDTELVSFMNRMVISFDWKMHHIEPGQKGGAEDKYKSARLEFTIEESGDEFPGVRPDRIFNVNLPSYVSGIEGGKKYTFEVNKSDSRKVCSLKFREFSQEEAESEFETIADKGLNPDELKKLAQKMAVKYADVIKAVPLEELIEKLSGTIFVGNKQVYEIGDLSSAMSEKESIIPRGREEAVEEAKRREEEEEEGEEQVKEFAGGMPELTQFLLNQGVRKPIIVKKISDKFPIVPKLKGQAITPLLRTRKMVHWALDLISQSKTPPSTKGTDPWMSIAVNDLVTGKAFKNNKDAEDLLINIIKMFGWEKAAKKELEERVGYDPRFDRSAFMKQKSLEILERAKQVVRKNENEIHIFYTTKFKDEIRSVILSMLTKDKDKNLMEILDNSGYRKIVEEVIHGEPISDKPAEIDSKKPIAPSPKAPAPVSEDAIIDAILRRDFEKLRSMGLKVTDKTEALIKTMKTMGKDGNPLPKEQWTSALTKFVERALVQAKKRTEKGEIGKKLKQLKEKLEKKAFDHGRVIYASLMDGIPVESFSRDHYSNIIHLIRKTRKGI